MKEYLTFVLCATDERPINLHDTFSYGLFVQVTLLIKLVNVTKGLRCNDKVFYSCILTLRYVTRLSSYGSCFCWSLAVMVFFSFFFFFSSLTLHQRAFCFSLGFILRCSVFQATFLHCVDSFYESYSLKWMPYE